MNLNINLVHTVLTWAGNSLITTEHVALNGLKPRKTNAYCAH